MNIYVGNVTYSATEQDIRDVFSAYGTVASVKLINDRETGVPKGFGFVEMPNDSEAEIAIAQLNNSELKGRALKINEARPKPNGNHVTVKDFRKKGNHENRRRESSSRY